MQKTRKGQLCLQKVTIALLRPANNEGWVISTDGELVTPEKPTVTLVPTGQTQNTSSDVPTCRYFTQK